MSLMAEHSFDVPALGKQASSQKYSASAFSFGSCSRERAGKVWISEKHELAKGKGEGPGPVYHVPGSTGLGPRFGFGTASQRTNWKTKYPDSSVDLTGASVDSQSVKFPGTRTTLFGTDSKDNMKNAVILKNHPQANFGIFSPGPCAYMPMETDVISKASPRISFGAKTKILSAESQTPRNIGPGSYPPTESIGKQAQSKKRSIAAWSFAQEKRMPPLKPGDTVVDPSPNLSSFGKQVTSKSSSGPGYGFGTSTRDHKAKTFLVMSPNDRGPVSSWAPPHMVHPKLPIERELLKIL